jgi:hypothetical protein
MTFHSVKRIGWWAVAFLAMACSSSGDETGSTNGAGGASNVSQVVGTMGASVTQSGVTLTIPANALTSDVPISVSVVAPPDGYSLVSNAYQFGPSGTTFLQPVAVTIPLTSAEPDAHMFWSNASGGFDDIGGTVNGLSVTANVTHFSIGFCAKGKGGGKPHPDSDSGAVGQGGAGGANGSSGQGGGPSTGGSSGAGMMGAGGASLIDASTAMGGNTGAPDATGAGGASIDSGSATDGNTSSTDATGAGGASSDATTVADAGTSSTEAAADTGGSAIDAAALCAPFGLNLPGAQVTYMDGSAPPDPSSYTGGTLISAKFTLAGVTHYGSGQYTGTRQAVYTIDATAQTIQIAQFSGYIGMTYVNVAPNQLLGTVVCNTGMVAAPAAFSYYYTATGATIKLTEVGSSDVLTINAPVN